MTSLEDETPPSIWGGLIPVLFSLEEGAATIANNPKLSSLHKRLMQLENTKSVAEVQQVLPGLFVETERKYLCSPLLDQLSTNFMKDDWFGYLCEKGYFEACQFLLKRGHPPTGLIKAAKQGRLSIIKLLLNSGADIHISDDMALRWACFYGHLDCVSLLLDHGADVHAANDDALFMASQRGHVDIIKILLDYGADVNANNTNALAQASYQGHIGVVRLLLERGADVHARNDHALTLANQKKHDAVVQILYEYM